MPNDNECLNCEYDGLEYCHHPLATTKEFWDNMDVASCYTKSNRPVHRQMKPAEFDWSNFQGLIIGRN